jgi:hypothetical protein
LFLDTTDDGIGDNLEDVEPDSLRDGSTLAEDNDVSFLDLEARRDMDGEVAMSLGESVILLDVVEIVSSDDDGSVHLARDDHSLEDLASDRDIAGERTLLIHIDSIDGLLGGLES